MLIHDVKPRNLRSKRNQKLRLRRRVITIVSG